MLNEEWGFGWGNTKIQIVYDHVRRKLINVTMMPGLQKKIAFQFQGESLANPYSEEYSKDKI
ncbi:hypothetical protein [Tatumella ptyseos]|uniref:hypothetical protein n=1 Tax=Tatumella ptyseos TaxID=82987 RepID=UPI0023F57E93|nr:hypothetical protein [Tatumella ptyseos]